MIHEIRWRLAYTAARVLMRDLFEWLPKRLIEHSELQILLSAFIKGIISKKPASSSGRRAVYVANFYYGNHLLEFSETKRFRVMFLLSTFNEKTIFRIWGTENATHCRFTTSEPVTWSTTSIFTTTELLRGKISKLFIFSDFWYLEILWATAWRIKKWLLGHIFPTRFMILTRHSLGKGIVG